MDYLHCECEHIAHFEKDKRTPCGNPSHHYGVKYHPSYLTVVSTPYGPFRVCKDCAADCLANPADVAAHIVETRR